MKTHSHILIVLSLFFWLAGAGSLLVKGGSLLLSAEVAVPGTIWPMLAAGLGLIVGAGKGWFVITSRFENNLSRIRSLRDPAWWNFFSGRFFGALALMIVAGFTMSTLASGQFIWLCVVGGVDTMVGIALAVSGIRGTMRDRRNQELVSF